MKHLSVIPLILLMTACFSDPGDAGSAIKVEVAKTEAGYRLLRGGEPYVIRGAGWTHSRIAELRLAYRDYGQAGRDDVGFRLARYAE